MNQSFVADIMPLFLTCNDKCEYLAKITICPVELDDVLLVSCILYRPKQIGNIKEE